MKKLNEILIVVIVLIVMCSHQGRTERYVGDSDFCSNYTTMTSCINDPCCKTGYFPESSCCDYCIEGNGFCMSHEMIWPSNCQTGCIVKHNQCPPKKPTVLQSRPPIVDSHGYYLNLTMTYPIVTNDSRGVAMAVSFFSDVATKDMVISDCCGACGAPILLCELSDTDPVCWPLGDSSTMTGSFISEKEPDKGVVLRYGTTNCCFRGPGEAPGKLDVEITIVPAFNAFESNELDLDWRVTHFLNISFLQNCSMAANGKVKGEIAFRDYFSRLVYKLSPSASNFSCTESWNRNDLNVTLTCQVIPVWVVNSSRAASFVCLRMKLSLFYSHGRHELVRISELRHLSDHCRFEVNGNRSMTEVGLLDYNDQPIGAPYNISTPNPDDSDSWIPVIVLPSIGSLLALGFAVIVGGYCWYKRRHNNQDSGPGHEPDDNTRTPLLSPQHPDPSIAAAIQSSQRTTSQGLNEVNDNVRDVQQSLDELKERLPAKPADN